MGMAECFFETWVSLVSGWEVLKLYKLERNNSRSVWNNVVIRNLNWRMQNKHIIMLLLWILSRLSSSSAPAFNRTKFVVQEVLKWIGLILIKSPAFFPFLDETHTTLFLGLLHRRYVAWVTSRKIRSERNLWTIKREQWNICLSLSRRIVLSKIQFLISTKERKSIFQKTL